MVRVGDTVRRVVSGPRENIHRLLDHLEAVGFDGAPRFLGIDGQGRETLTFINGDVTASGPIRGLAGEAALVAAATLLRRYHDATRPFAEQHQHGWRFQVGAPRSGPVICHNDFGPYNCVYRQGQPVAIIDWDLAAPGPAEWDMAYALWRFVPLYDDAQCAALGWSTTPRGPRIRRFLDAYGDPAYQQLVSEGRLDEIASNIQNLEAHKPEWKIALTPSRPGHG